MDDLLQALRDLTHSVADHPAEWSDDHLAEISNLSATLRGHVETERLYRAANFED